MQRNPLHAFPRSNLAHALRGAGRYAEARAGRREGDGREPPDRADAAAALPARRAAGGPGARAASRSTGPPTTRAASTSAARAGRSRSITGRVREARRLFEETMKEATDRGFPQVASGYAAQAAFAEVLYGYGRPPLEQARSVVRSATAYEPQLRAATALALGGEPSEADALVRRLRGVRPAGHAAAERLPAGRRSGRAAGARATRAGDRTAPPRRPLRERHRRGAAAGVRPRRSAAARRGRRPRRCASSSRS